MPTSRILLHDVLPDVMPTLIVPVPILLAASIVTESARSFLSIGVQSPDAKGRNTVVDGGLMILSLSGISLPVFGPNEVMNLLSQSR